MYEEYSKTKCDQAAVQRLTELDHRFAPALCIMGFLAENILDSGTDNANVEVISISSEPSVSKPKKKKELKSKSFTMMYYL